MKKHVRLIITPPSDHSTCLARFLCAASSAICLAVPHDAAASDKTWKPGVEAGFFADDANWIGDVAPVAGDTAWISNGTHRVTLPSDTSTFEGLLKVVAPSPFDETSPEVALDASDSVFSIGSSSLDAKIREIVRGWEYSSGKWRPTGWIMEGFRLGAGTNYEIREPHLTLDGVMFTVGKADDGALIDVSGGTMNFKKRLFLRGYAGGGTTNWTTLARTGGHGDASNDTRTGIELQAYSRLRLGPGNYAFRIATNPKTVTTGDDAYSVVGPAEIEFLDGATNSIGVTQSGYEPALGEKADGLGTMTMRGRSYFKNLQESSASGANFTVAKGTGSMASLAMLDSSQMILQGNYAGNGGHLFIASGANSRGEVLLRDSARIEARFSMKLGGSGATALLDAADSSQVRIESVGGLVVGMAGTADACVAISGNATIDTPKIVTQADVADSGFTRSELRLLGGSVVTKSIEGSNTLSVVCGGGVLRAKAASTAAAPFLHGVASFAGADGAAPIIVIDTQNYDTYVNQDFGADATVVKRGSGILHVLADSSHARTLVEAGSVVLENGATQFGFALSPRDMTWAGDSGAGWGIAGNWMVCGAAAEIEPTLIDAATVSGAAAIAMPGMAHAKSLSLAGDGTVALSGDGGLALAQALVLAPTTSPKVVENAGDIVISTPSVTASGNTLAKQGSGLLSISFTTTGDKVLPLNVREGTMRLKGPASSTASISVGTASLASAPVRAVLALDNFSTSGDMSIGGGSAAVAELILTNGASADAPGGKTIYLGANGATSQKSHVTVCSGARVRSDGAAGWTGRIYLGNGLDMRVEGLLEAASGTSSDYGWLRPVVFAQNSTVTVADGGRVAFNAGFAYNNSSATITEASKFTMVFDGGVFAPAVQAGVGSRYCVMRAPELQGFVAAQGGMVVDMANCPRYVIACPVRGSGALLKTGSGTLVMGTGRNFNYAGSGVYTDNDVTNSAKFVESGVATVQNAGGVVVRDGAVEVERDATDTNSCFTVDAGATLDLVGNSVAVGIVKGAGTVANGGFSAVTFAAATSADTVPTVSDIAFSGKVFVDFGCDAEHPAEHGTTYFIARLCEGVTGLRVGDERFVPARNTGDENYGKAKLAVRADGVVTAQPVPDAPTVVYVR